MTGSTVFEETADSGLSRFVLTRFSVRLGRGDVSGVTTGVFDPDVVFPPASPPNAGGETSFPGLDIAVSATFVLGVTGLDSAPRRVSRSIFVSNTDSLPRDDGVIMSATDPCIGEPFAELVGVSNSGKLGLALTDPDLCVGGLDLVVGATGITSCLDSHSSRLHWSE